MSEIEPEFCALDQEGDVEGVGLGENGRIPFHHEELRSMWGIPQWKLELWASSSVGWLAVEGQVCESLARSGG